jgi:hypothetical protein
MSFPVPPRAQRPLRRQWREWFLWINSGRVFLWHGVKNYSVN